MYYDEMESNGTSGKASNVAGFVAVLVVLGIIVVVVYLVLTYSPFEGYGRLQPLKGNKINLNHYVPSPAKVEYDLLHNKVRENISWGTTKYPIDMKLFNDQNLPLN